MPVYQARGNNPSAFCSVVMNPSSLSQHTRTFKNSCPIYWTTFIYIIVIPVKTGIYCTICFFTMDSHLRGNDEVLILLPGSRGLRHGMTVLWCGFGAVLLRWRSGTKCRGGLLTKFVIILKFLTIRSCFPPCFL